MESRLKNMYPDPAVYPQCEAMVCVAITYPGSGGEVTKVVRGERKEYRFRSILDADNLFTTIAREMCAAYRAGKYELGPLAD